MGLDTVELLFAVEEHFDIHVPNEVAAKRDTVGLLHEFICAELDRLGRHSLTAEQVLRQLIGLVADHSGVDAAHISAESQFVADLRMD